MAITRFNVNAVAICVNCRIIWVIQGKGCWIDPSELPDGQTSMNHLSSVACYGCTGLNAFRIVYETSFVYPRELMSKYANEVCSVSSVLGVGTVYFMIPNDDADTSKYVPINAINNDHKFRSPITSATTMPRNMPFTYTVKSIHEGKLVDSHPNLFRSGPTTGRPIPFTIAPHDVYTALFCPGCGDDVVYVGKGSFSSTRLRPVKTEVPNRLFSTVCRKCTMLNRTFIHGANTSTYSSLIEGICRVVAGNMVLSECAFKSGSGDINATNIGNSNVEIIVHAVADFCELFSVVDDKLVSTVKGFI